MAKYYFEFGLIICHQRSFLQLLYLSYLHMPHGPHYGEGRKGQFANCTQIFVCLVIYCLINNCMCDIFSARFDAGASTCLYNCFVIWVLRLIRILVVSLARLDVFATHTASNYYLIVSHGWTIYKYCHGTQSNTIKKNVTHTKISITDGKSTHN